MQDLPYESRKDPATAPADPERSDRRFTLVLAMVGLLLVLSTLVVSHWRRTKGSTVPPCASRLRVIGQALLLYHNETGVQRPADLANVLAHEQVAPQMLLCEWTEKPFVYVGAGLPAHATADAILAYDPPEHHGGQGIHVVFADGRVDWIPRPEAQRFVAELDAGHNPPRPATAPSTSQPTRNP